MKLVSLECKCGSLNGELKVVSNKKSYHIHCLCSDCQSFATYLQNEDKILDKFGGSELFQTYPAYIKITKGKENSLMRWHTSCCNMPIANTMTSASVPFVGLSVKLMKFSSEEEKLNILGPVILKSFGKSARGTKPLDAYDTFPKSYMLKMLRFMLVGWLGSKNKPSPFFTGNNPVSKPKVLA